MTDLTTTQDVYSGMRTVRARPLVKPVARDLSKQVLVDDAAELLDIMLDLHWSSFHTLPTTEERNKMRDTAWAMAIEQHGDVKHER